VALSCLRQDVAPEGTGSQSRCRQAPPPGQQVLIFSRGKALRWRAVVINRDSVTGVPYQMPTKCDTCRLGLPRAAVDSMRRYHEVSFLRPSVWASVLLPSLGDSGSE